jgi:hypothetical protein
MSTFIKPATEYTDYDTTSASTSVTLTAVEGKEYEVRNSGSGGNTLTITYGSNSYVLNDGVSGKLTYDGTGWSAQFSDVGGSVSLSSGRRKFADAKETKDAPADAWLAVAKTSLGSNVTASAVFQFTNGTTQSSTISGTLTTRASVNQRPGFDKENVNLNIIHYPDADSGSNFGGIRLGYVEGDETAGCYLMVKTNFLGERDIYTFMSENIGKLEGWELIDALEDDGSLVAPDGESIIDAYIEAGAEYTISHTNRTPTGITGGRLNDDVASFKVITPNKVKASPSSLTIDTSGASYCKIVTTSGVEVVDLLTDTYTVSPDDDKDNSYRIQLTSTGAFSGVGLELMYLLVTGDVTFTLS